MKIAIIGHGFVGKAIDNAFRTNGVELLIIDPIYNTTLEDLNSFEADVSFVSVPTPMKDNKEIDSKIVEHVVDYLCRETNSLIVVKSTITPNIVSNFLSFVDADRFVYNPEFLTERNSNHDFINADHHVLGGSDVATKKLSEIYANHSRCVSSDFVHMSAEEASFVKYSVNSFLAMKVIFFNQLYDLVNQYDCDYEKIVSAITADDRIDTSHTKVADNNRRRGFGGACFPKDINAFIEFSNNNLSLLEAVSSINNQYRKDYDAEDREKANNINFTNNKRIIDNETISVETVAKYWSHRGFVGKELAYRIQETLKTGELVDDSNDACKVCE
tara:strand:- start:4539 stop:5528 length:990 start_codon:yes stop_codon:yes gene_type:complete